MEESLDALVSYNSFMYSNVFIDGPFLFGDGFDIDKFYSSIDGDNTFLVSNNFS